MRFLKYIKTDQTPEQLTFRQLHIGIIKEDDSVYTDIIKKYQYTDLLEMIDLYNKKTRSILNYKYKLGLCLDEGVSIDKIKTDKKERLLSRLDELNTELSLTQKRFEKGLLYGDND